MGPSASSQRRTAPSVELSGRAWTEIGRVDSATFQRIDGALRALALRQAALGPTDSASLYEARELVVEGIALSYQFDQRRNVLLIDGLVASDGGAD